MSFVVGGLYVNESVELAQLHAESGSWENTLQTATETGLASLPKIASRRRTLREIIIRISQLSSTETEYLVTAADRFEQQALLWIATCRAYRFVREFTVDVVRERYLSLKLDLPLETFDIFFADKAEWDEGLSKITPSTRLKLRQILFRMLREAGIISEDRRILSPDVSARLRTMLEDQAPQDLLLFPGLVDVGGRS
jgi:hypothetical protein